MNLVSLMSLSKAELKTKIETIDASAVKGRGLRRKLETMKRKQGGFTLLELLVVVAILAAIAGTATTMLQDTDRKGAAAAHVAMMDELSKGIQTFRVLNQGNYPNKWDSLMRSADGTLTAAAIASEIIEDTLESMLQAVPTPDLAEVNALANVGITQLRVISSAGVPLGVTAATPCSAANIVATIEDKSNNVTPQNIFRPAAANGCGVTGDATIAATTPLVRWVAAQNPRVNADTADVIYAFGVGPDSTLFRPDIIGALSNVPVYRHVANNEYNRFVVLFKAAGTGVKGQAIFQAIVDGAGDTKDEELGEVDNVRST